MEPTKDNLAWVLEYMPEFSQEGWEAEEKAFQQAVRSWHSKAARYDDLTAHVDESLKQLEETLTQEDVIYSPLMRLQAEQSHWMYAGIKQQLEKRLQEVDETNE